MLINKASRHNTKVLAFILSATLLPGLITADAPRGTSAAEQKEIRNPFASDPAAIKQGQSVFRLNCALCHGIDARGGRGPDLTSGHWTYGDSDAAIFNTILKGVPGTEMPGSDLTEDEIWTIVSFLRSLGAGSGSPVLGDRQAGQKIFFGEGMCSQCHMVNGKGGRLGPDLSRIGAVRSAQYLIESIRDPSKQIPQGYETVSVLTKDGKRITGVRKNEDTFSIQLMDQKEQIHLFLKKDLKETIYDRKSLMPEYNERMLGEKELQDLLAYLDSLRG